LVIIQFHSKMHGPYNTKLRWILKMCGKDRDQLRAAVHTVRSLCAVCSWAKCLHLLTDCAAEGIKQTEECLHRELNATHLLCLMYQPTITLSRIQNYTNHKPQFTGVPAILRGSKQRNVVNKNRNTNATRQLEDFCLFRICKFYGLSNL
jgi:hypothetical protein